MATATRKAPPTHPTVWVGLGLAAIGLLVAMFAYSGTRVYDITFALVATLGALVATVGILMAAWGRAIMSARAQRSRRAAMRSETLKLNEMLEAPPTVAEPPVKRRLDVKAWMGRRAKDEAADGNGRSPEKPRRPLFALRGKASTSGAAGSAAVEVAPPAAAPQRVRLTLECPNCQAQFEAEGERPFVASCPACGHAEAV